MIKAKNIMKNYGRSIVINNMSFNVNEDILGIIGSSGRGKTTLLRCISGLEDFTGKIIVRGDVSFLFQEDISCSWLSVYDNIILPLKLKKKKVEKKAVLRIAKFLKIEACLTKKISEISGGQKQRMFLAQIILLDTKVVLLDEPFKSLDTELILYLIEKLFKEFKKKKKTVIIATHNKVVTSKIKNKIFM